MALHAPLTTPTGQTVTYWRILAVTLDLRGAAEQVTIHVGGYASEAARQGGLDHDAYRMIEVTGDEMTALMAAADAETGTFGQRLLAAAYGHLRRSTREVPNPSFDPSQPETTTNASMLHVAEFSAATDA